MPWDLRTSPVLQSVATDALRALIACGHARRFPRHALIFQRGDEPDGLYLIASGQVRVTLDAADGLSITVAVMQAGDVLGELSLIDGAERSATAVAVTRVEALFVPADAFDGWLAAHPEAVRAIARGLAGRVRTTDKQLASIALLDAGTRVRTYLYEGFLAAAGGPGEGDRTRIRINQTEVGATLGLRRETVNRELRRLADEGAIAIERGSAVLLSPEALRPATSVL